MSDIDTTLNIVLCDETAIDVVLHEDHNDIHVTIGDDTAIDVEIQGGIGTVPEHNLLTGLQGGDTDEYYHLTSAQTTKLNDVADNAIANVVEDTTPQLGGDLEYNNHNLVFNVTLTSDETASGDIITVTFGEDVVFGKLCYPDTTANEWMLGLGTNVAVKHPVRGVALESKGNGETGKLLIRGIIRSSTYFSAFSSNDGLWLSDGTAGLWVNAAPSDSGDIVQMVGWVIATNYALFNPDLTYIEVP